jgi:glucose/arabinose dehydrogenase/mono/diheme cytochrome c family protein
MTFRKTGTLLGLLAISSAFAQNGDNKGHHSMNEIVPKNLIPPAPVLTVDEALKTFTVEKGFVIEPVAAEPLVEKPVALTFDERGRMWVCEMRGYMPDIDGKGEDKPVGRIAILEDTDQDGKIDKRTTFLDEIMLPRTILLVPEGVIFADQSTLYLTERDGDKPKGAPKVLDKNYSSGGNVEHKPNGMMPGIDNWLYNSKSGTRYKFTDGKLISDKTANRGQWGITRDNFGRIFHNSNSTILVGDRTLPNLLIGNNSVNNKAKMDTRVGDNSVYPGRVTPGLNRAYISELNGYTSNTIDPKTFKLTSATGACGPVIYRGTNFPSEYDGNAFICESSAQLIKTVKVDAKDGNLNGSHPLKKRDFITSTDERFRPVNIYNAPDGSLYILDMYHGIIQHRTYMTSYLRAQTLSRGLDGPGLGHGRIYRVRAANKPLEKVPNFEKADSKDLITALNSPVGAVRDLAQKLLIERKAPAGEVRSALTAGPKNPLTVIHLIWTLEGLGALEATDLENALASGDEGIVASALYASLSLVQDERAKLTESIANLEVKPMTLPYQARVLASIGRIKAQAALVALLRKHGKVSLVREAAVAGIEKNAKLFQSVNKGQYSDKEFDKWIEDSLKGPQREIDPATLLKGEHLASFDRGKQLYSNEAGCFGCHGPDGAGLDGLGPQLDGSDWVSGDQERLVRVLLHGLTGPIKINGKHFESPAFMPGLGQNPSITDQSIADLATFIRANWTNRAPQVDLNFVVKIRKDSSDRDPSEMYTQADFEKK